MKHTERDGTRKNQSAIGKGKSAKGKKESKGKRALRKEHGKKKRTRIK